MPDNFAVYTLGKLVARQFGNMKMLFNIGSRNPFDVKQLIKPFKNRKTCLLKCIMVLCRIDFFFYGKFMIL